MKGRQITSLSQLVDAAKERKAVVSNHGMFVGRHQPAAFIVMMSGELIHDLMLSGLYLYEKEAKKK